MCGEMCGTVHDSLGCWQNTVCSFDDTDTHSFIALETG